MPSDADTARLAADVPEGTLYRKVLVSETLFQELGAQGVDWGEPGADGFYSPTIYGPSRLALAEAVVEAARDARDMLLNAAYHYGFDKNGNLVQVTGRLASAIAAHDSGAVG